MGNTGWICPKCGNVWAPHVSQCMKCDTRFEIKRNTTKDSDVVCRECGQINCDPNGIGHYRG